MAIPEKKDFDFTNAEDGRHIPEACHLNRRASLCTLKDTSIQIVVPFVNPKTSNKHSIEIKSYLKRPKP